MDDKEKSREYYRKYYLANKEKIKERVKKYWHKNKEEINEKRREYFKEYNANYHKCDVAKEARKRWRKNNPDKVRKQKIKDYEDNKERYIEYQTKWSIDNREKKRAHVAIYDAIKRGDIIKPTKCSKCDKEKRLHAHHEDYTKPLEVKWLCQSCHIAEHKRHRD